MIIMLYHRIDINPDNTGIHTTYRSLFGIKCICGSISNPPDVRGRLNEKKG
jgi:hypothetical protein